LHKDFPIFNISNENFPKPKRGKKKKKKKQKQDLEHKLGLPEDRLLLISVMNVP
jgi:hypothetical protein